jgi:hypothetical protein
MLTNLCGGPRISLSVSQWKGNESDVSWSISISSEIQGFKLHTKVDMRCAIGTVKNKECEKRSKAMFIYQYPSSVVNRFVLSESKRWIEHLEELTAM